MNMNYTAQGDYRFVTRMSLKSDHLTLLINAFEAPDEAAPHRLEGRRSISRVYMDGVGAVVVKHYRRGGILAPLMSKYYLKWGKTRCQIEFEQMSRARTFGIQTPEPIAFAYRGIFFYRAWLVMREVKPSVPLAQLSRIAPERARVAMEKLGRELELLVGHRIRHADFHPGNILVDDRDQVYIIDFDKAGTYGGSQARLRAAYARRWCRAVRKHALPPMLYELTRN